ncbi:MAG: TolC family protein [Methylococcales bacterium]|nr:TolC family protein [Methylococcales bacterium]
MADVNQPGQTRTPSVFETKPLGMDHQDPIEIDPTLTLGQLIDITIEKYPDRLIGEALAQEAEALSVRADSWFAGSNALYLDYADDTVTNGRGYSDADAKLEFTPWFWGQRSAAQGIASHAHTSAQKQSAVMRLEVAHLVREALWSMTLADIRLQQAKYTLDLSAQLLEKVRLRVELGDLARTDLLLAESEYLQNRSLYNQAEAEMMHTRKNYANLTRITRVPPNFNERQSPIDSIREDHPFLEAINALIDRKRATIEWAKTTDTINQPKFNIGAQTSHSPMGGGTSQTAGIGVVIPFGHSTYDAPEIAAANLALNSVLAQREHMMRTLEKNLHEAEHALELSRAELSIAHELKQIAEAHLKMTEISFASGEINLLDLLKIQARSLEALRNAKEQEVKFQRNIALYNQAVGVTP